MKFFNIPFAIGLTIDDMGWQLGQDDRPLGPPRLESKENSRSEFYDSIISMCKACGTRAQGSFVMSEFDRENICAKPCYNKPISPIDITEKGLNWTCERDDSQVYIMSRLKKENAFLELGLHGVRHGHFENNEWLSSEWAKRPLRDNKDNIIDDKKNVSSWDNENKTSEIIADCYTELLRQYFTKEELFFPESFAPPNHALYFDFNHNTTGAILSKRGVKYCNAKITGSASIECPIPKQGVIDHGMHILDRRSLRGVPFHDSAHVPYFYPRKYPWIETHFKDFWYTEKQWSHYLYNINKKSKFILAKNTEQVHSQFFYNKYAKITNLPGKIIIDTNNIPNEVYENNLLSSLVIKVKLRKKENISDIKCKNCSIVGYYKDVFSYAYLTIGSKSCRLEKGKYIIEYKIGRNKPNYIYVDNSLETYNLYNLEESENCIKIDLKVYGEQTLRIKCSKPNSVVSSNLNIIKTEYYDIYSYVTIKAKSMNGDVGNIILNL